MFLKCASSNDPTSSSRLLVPCSLDPLFPALFAEHAHLRLVALLAVHIHGQIFEVINQLFQVLWLDLRQRQRYTMPVQCLVQLIVRLLRNQTRQPHARAQQLHWHTHIHRRQPFVPRHRFVRFHQHPQILRPRRRRGGLRAVAARAAVARPRRRRCRLQCRQQPLCLVRGNLARGKHLQNLSPVLVHRTPPHTCVTQATTLCANSATLGATIETACTTPITNS